MSQGKSPFGNRRGLPRAATVWRAIADRDARYDGRFVYAVTSTGVFCRPSCPSRRPQRSNVQFFSDPEAASRAGFRPCRRCRPTSAEPSRREAAIAAAARYLADHATERVTLATLARQTELSPFHLQRAFKQALGVSPREYQDALRHRRFVKRLRAGDTVSRATYEAGYGSSSRVYGRREVRAGMTPGAYRRRAQDREIHFATVAVPLGQLLVAYTGDGVCAVELGDDDAALERTLRADFAGASIVRAPRDASAWVHRVADMASGRIPPVAVPLDVRGTAFQWKVWKALQRIPVGKTRSYAEIARAIGRPTAVRAVAGACARNPVALVVPCHRVVQSDGGLGGYRWGIARKREILRAEQGNRKPD